MNILHQITARVCWTTGLNRDPNLFEGNLMKVDGLAFLVFVKMNFNNEPFHPSTRPFPKTVRFRRNRAHEGRFSDNSAAQTGLPDEKGFRQGPAF